MASSQPSGSPSPHQVTISYTNGQISVNPQTITVNRSKHEHIVWVADGEFDFYVCFEKETPFGSRHYHRQSNRSGPARSDAEGRYKYSVEIGDQVLDPDVIIRPQ